jgi:hypothetical protein
MGKQQDTSSLLAELDTTTAALNQLRRHARDANQTEIAGICKWTVWKLTDQRRFLQDTDRDDAGRLFDAA